MKTKKTNRHIAKTKHTHTKRIAKERERERFSMKKKQSIVITTQHVTNKKLVTGCLAHDKRE
jgi:hypothetical protein